MFNSFGRQGQVVVSSFRKLITNDVFGCLIGGTRSAGLRFKQLTGFRCQLSAACYAGCSTEHPFNIFLLAISVVVSSVTKNTLKQFPSSPLY